jgi:hypothetical protein
MRRLLVKTVLLYSDFSFSDERKEYCGDVADLKEFKLWLRLLNLAKILSQFIR